MTAVGTDEDLQLISSLVAFAVKIDMVTIGKDYFVTFSTKNRKK